MNRSEITEQQITELMHAVPKAEEVDALRAEVDALRAEVERLRAEVKRLRAPLRWYGTHARSVSRTDPYSSLIALTKDGGERARKALEDAP